MNLENLHQPIKTESMQEHRELLHKKLMDVQIAFISKKYAALEGEKPLFVEFFSQYSRDINTLRMMADDGYKSGNLGSDVDTFMSGIMKKINHLAENGTPESYASISEIISSEYLKLEGMTSHNHPEENLGLISFNPEKEESLEKYGFNTEDSFFEIHLKNVYANKIQAGMQEIKNEFSKIAELIIDKYPEDRAVVGTSWLMNHPLVQRLGFTVVESDKEAGMASWSQFIDKDGQIDARRVEQALETGEKPFKTMLGYIPTEEFLQKYLPENRRGLVTLKTLDTDKMYLSELQQEFPSILSKFLTQSAPPEEFIESIPSMSRVCDELGIKDKILVLLAEVQASGETIPQVRESAAYAQLSLLGEKITQYIKDNKYRNITIEIK